MDRILYKGANGDLICRSRDFDKIFPTLYAYEELEMTPEDIEKTLLAFSSFLMEMTGGRMSKTNYTVQAMVDEANDYRNREIEELEAELEGMKNSYQQLQEINDRTYQSNMAMGKDLEEVRADRDFLLQKLRELDMCDSCKHVEKAHNEEPCWNCEFGPKIVEREEEKDNWEWAGRRNDHEKN